MEQKNISILIVEDEALIAKSMSRNLKLAGYAIHGPVATGEDALASIVAQPPDLILMDIRLPGRLDGIQTAREIRTQYDIPVIFITGYSDAQTISRAQQVNPAAFLEKPLFFYQLQSAINAALAGH